MPSANRLIVNIGQTVNDSHGDPLRTAFEKVNTNFQQLYDTGVFVAEQAPAHDYGKVGDLAGTIAADSNYFYYCFRNYVNDTTVIWKKISWISGS